MHSFVKLHVCRVSANQNSLAESGELQNGSQTFNLFPDNPGFLHVYSTSLENTVRKGEIARNEQFSFSQSVFSPFGELSAIFIKLKIVVCKLFQFGIV